MDAPDVVVEAARVVVIDGIAHAEGPVRITVGADVVTGASATFDADRQHATVTDGTWCREGVGVLTFGEATVDLVDGTGSATEASFKGAGGFAATGDALSLRADGTLTGDHVALTLCDCDGVKPWSVTARHVVFDAGASLKFRGGVVRVLDVPVLPVPAGDVPLSRRSGFLAPTLAYGQYGVVAAAPLYLTLGPSADLTLTPEIRTGRTTHPSTGTELRTSPTARLVIEQRYAAAAVHGTSTIAAGWDGNTSTWRGGVDADHRFGDGTLGAAVIGRLTSDPDVSADYGDGFLARQQPWNEVRGLGWAGPMEASVDGVQAVDPSVQRASILAHVGDRRGPVVYDGYGGVFAETDGTDGGRWIGIADGLHAHDTAWLGPLRLTTSGIVEAAVATAVDAPALRSEATVAGVARLVVPAWHARGASIARLEPGVELAYAPLAPVGAPFPSLRPTIGWSHTGSYDAGFDLAASPDLPSWSTWTGSATAYAAARGLTAWGQTAASTGALGTSAVGFSAHHGAADLAASWIYAPSDAIRQPDPATPKDLDQARLNGAWTLPGALASVRLGAGAAWDVAGGQFLSRTATVRWTHASGCLAIDATARFDRDRAFPDVAIRIDPWPSR